MTLGSSPNQLVDAVDAVCAGRFFVPSTVAADLTGVMVRRSNNLSPRERDVLRLIAGGLSNRDAGRKLGVSERTVESHRRNLMKKLELHRVVDLVRYAIRESLISP
jgi:two-component system NarL family response regulator